MQPVSQPRSIIRRPQVLACTGISDTTLWRLMRAGTFPRPIKLSSQRVGWFLDEVIEWQAAKAAERG
jgi:prophage regulatory protein